MARKAIVFSIDMMVSAAVLILAIATINFVHHATTTQSANFQTMNAASRDIIKLLSETTVSEASSIPEIGAYISDGNISSLDLDKTLLDMIGSFWADGQNEKAAYISEAVFKSYLPPSLHYSLYIDDEPILSNNRNYSSSVSSSAIVSGYKAGEPVSGYIARAWTTTVVGMERQIIDISPLGSGFGNNYGRGGNLTILKQFEIPSNATNISAEFFMSMHEESGWIFVFMNDVLQDMPIGNDCYHPTSQCYDKIRIYNITNGTNILKVEVGRPSTYHSHTHPGSILVVDYYNERDSSYYRESNVHKTINLTGVTGSPCVWETFPFDIPKGSEIHLARLRLNMEGLDDFLDVHVNEFSIYTDHSPPSSVSLDLDIRDQLHKDLNYTPELKYHDEGYNWYTEVYSNAEKAVRFRQSDLPENPDAYTFQFYARRRNSPGNLSVFLETELNSTPTNLIATFTSSQIGTSYAWRTVNITSSNFSNQSADHYFIFQCNSCSSGWWGNNYRLGYDTNSLGNSSFYNSSGWSQSSADYMATLYFNSTPIPPTNVSTGETNTLAIYGDIGSLSDTYMSGATGTATINLTSHIELNYTTPQGVSQYGAIPYNVIEKFGGNEAREKQINFDIPDLPLLEAYFHPVQKFSYRLAAAAWKNSEPSPSWSSNNYNPSSYRIFRSPTSRNIPSSIFIPIDRFSQGKTNHLIARDFGGSATNYLLPNSSIDYTIFVPSQVPYGSVFPSAESASLDAEQRLNATFTAYNISGNFTIGTANIAGIKTLWGPSKIKVVLGS